MRKTTLLAVVAVLLLPLSLLAQVVTGKVTGPTGKPVEGVTVTVKGTKTATFSKEDGSFSIAAANGTTLVFSSVGFKTVEAKAGTSPLSISLPEGDNNLEEVVVVAYGTVKKEALTGSVGTVKAEQIAKRPIANVTNAIEGAIPGVVTSSTNGQPGSGLSIRVRGFGSINASNDPLFVVDGVPYVGGTSNLNPDDIESISVLKDAASSALYGSRAANGVVIVTTKKGKKGRNNISIRGMQGIATRGLQEYETVNAFEYYPVLWEAYRNSLVYPATGTGISIDSASRVASGLTTRTGIAGLLTYNPFNVAANSIVGTDGKLNASAQLLYPDDLDWTKDLMRNGNRQDYTVNFNGGAEKSDYFFSAGYLKENGYTIKSDLQRFTARLNVNVQPKTWIKTGLNIAGNYTTSNTANDDDGAGSTSFVNPFFFSRNVGPIYPVYLHNMTNGSYVLDQNGERIWDLGNMANTAVGLANGVQNRPSGGFGGRHVLAETKLNDLTFRRTVLSARNYVDIMFLKHFKLTSNVAADLQSQTNSTFENTLVGDGAPGGRSRRQSGTNSAFTASQLLSYNNKFGEHKVDVLVGHENFNQMLTDLNGFKQGQSLTGNTELGNFTSINSLTSSIDRYRVESYFSQVRYDYQSKYFLSGSIRRDGNSRFAEESRWGTFWSVGGGWNLDKEKFLKNVSWVNFLKLRSSYGEVGNADGIGYYAYQGLYGFANNANEAGIVQSQTAFLNKKLTWEINKQFDLGLDFSFFKNRLNGSIEYYKRETEDLLFAVPLALSTGALTLNQNTATMYNKGIEVQLNGDIVRTKNFTWNMGVNASTVKSRITKMPTGVDEFINGTKKFSVDHSQYDYWLRTYYGVDPTDGAALYVPLSNATATGRRVVANKNGGMDTVTTLIANAKFEYAGTTIPDVYGSMTQTITFKQFTLSALFTFQLGGKTYDALYASLMSSGNYGGALHKDILKRWQKAGDITDVPRMDVGRTADFNGTSSRWLVDASYFNIRSINLSYTLPANLLNKIDISNGSIFVSAENLAFFSKRKGLNNQQAFSGVTSNAYPPARVLSAGITLNL